MNAVNGIWAPALTPLQADLAPDHAGCAAHVERLLGAGCHGVVLFGTTGEASSFSVEERGKVLEAVLAAGVAPERIMVGTGCCALSDTITLSRHALTLGCRKLLVLPPFYYKRVSDRGIFAGYEKLIDALDGGARIFLYHFPRLSAVPITMPLIRFLAENFGEVIAGIKDSSGEREHTLQLIEKFPHLSVFPGTEMLLADTLRAGGAGCITATANVNAEAIRRTYDLFLNKDPAAEKSQAAINAVRTVLNRVPMISALKWIMAKRENNDHWLHIRPPLEPLSIPDAEKIMRGLRLGEL